MRRRPYRRRKWGMPLFLIFVVALLIFTVTLFERQIRPNLESVAEARAKSVATRAIADAVNEVMSATETEYSDLIIFQKNANNNITAVTSNVIAINSLKAVVTTAIDKKLSSLNNLCVNIPIGNFLGHSLFSGLGPKIKIHMTPVGYAEISVKNCFSSGGINQTKHEIYLNVKCGVSILLPVSTKAASITTQIPLAETVIVGIVPDSYTNVEGTEEPPEDAVLNLVK